MSCGATAPGRVAEAGGAYAKGPGRPARVAWRPSETRKQMTCSAATKNGHEDQQRLPSSGSVFRNLQSERLEAHTPQIYYNVENRTGMGL